MMRQQGRQTARVGGRGEQATRSDTDVCHRRVQLVNSALKRLVVVIMWCAALIWWGRGNTPSSGTLNNVRFSLHMAALPCDHQVSAIRFGSSSVCVRGRRKGQWMTLKQYRSSQVASRQLSLARMVCFVHHLLSVVPAGKGLFWEVRDRDTHRMEFQWSHRHLRPRYRQARTPAEGSRGHSKMGGGWGHQSGA